jgi:hypothetical protein
MPDGPHLYATPWSQTPTTRYEEVSIALFGAHAEQDVLILLSKRNNFSMMLKLNAPAMDELVRALTTLLKSFKKEMV